MDSPNQYVPSKLYIQFSRKTKIMLKSIQKKERTVAWRNYGSFSSRLQKAQGLRKEQLCSLYVESEVVEKKTVLYENRSYNLDGCSLTPILHQICKPRPHIPN